MRAAPPSPLSAESFLRNYGLTTPEGVALMCVAEALLRIPDADTADALIRDKLAGGNWSTASAADWALMLTGTLAKWHDAEERNFPTTVKRLIARLGEPVVRAAVRQAMRILAGQFVLAETIEDAVKRGTERRPYRFSFDMLGEAARTAQDAANYLTSYTRAINAVRPPDALSIKLSALHPRFEEAKRDARFLGAAASCPAAGAHRRAAWRRRHPRRRGVGAPRADAGSVRSVSARSFASAWPCRPTRSARWRCANGWHRSSAPSACAW